MCVKLTSEKINSIHWRWALVVSSLTTNQRYSACKYLWEHAKCACVCVWVHVCSYVCWCASMNERKRYRIENSVCMFIHICIYICVYLQKKLFIWIYKNIYIYVYIHIFTYIYTFIYIYIYKYIYICIHVYVYICTYIELYGYL